MTRFPLPSMKHPLASPRAGAPGPQSALATLLATATLALSALMPLGAQAQQPAATPAATPAVTLRWAAQNDILTLDPHSQNHSTTSAILMHAYEGLVRYDADRKIEPALATKWTYISPTQVRFELRRNVRFHDGTPFTADDVIFSFNRIRQPQGTMGIYVTGIAEIRKIDSHTVDFMMAAPNPLLLRNIVDFRLMSKAWAEKNKSTDVQNYKAKEENYASRNVMGTGPYMITGWVPDQRVTMKVNPNWWDKSTSNITDVVYTPIKSDPTRVAALIAGDVDLLTDLPTQDVARLRQDSKLKVVDGPEVRTIFLALDQHSNELKYSDVKGKNPFKDKRVREALSIVVDREAIKRTIMRGLSIPAALMVPPGVEGWSAELDTVSRPDVDRAKKLMAEAGYPNGFEFQLNCSNNRYVNDEEVCQALLPMWAKIGMKVRLVAEPFAQHSVRFQNFDTSAYMLGWGVATFDAQYTLQSIVRTRTTGADGNFNFARVSDPQLDQLVDAMKTEMDATKRMAMMREALKRTRDEHLLLPLHHQMRPWAMKPGVTTLHRSDDRPEARFTSVR